MTFYQLIITATPASDVETLSDALFAEGAAAVTLQDNSDDPILEPLPNTTPLWNHTQLTALFQDLKLLQEAIDTVSRQFTDISYTIAPLVDQDWLQAARDHFKPMCFANRLWIYPSWDPPPNPAPHLSMQLNPGLAFGTGTHPTTAMCLEWLAQRDLHQQSLIDFGCGSGILTIAALTLGASSVIATDIDEQALQACLANASLNAIAPQRLSVIHATQLPHDLQCDILIANILAQPIMELAPKFMSYLKKNGVLLLTGILNSQKDAVIARYLPFCKLECINVVDDWCLLIR